MSSQVESRDSKLWDNSVVSRSFKTSLRQSSNTRCFTSLSWLSLASPRVTSPAMLETRCCLHSVNSSPPSQRTRSFQPQICTCTCVSEPIKSKKMKIGTTTMPPQCSRHSKLDPASSNFLFPMPLRSKTSSWGLSGHWRLKTRANQSSRKSRLKSWTS